MERFKKDFSFIILDEIALEGLDGITIEALCKRLSNNCDWPLKPVDDSIKKIIWSFVVFLKNVDFYRLENPRDPLIIYNRFEYIHTDFGSLYEPENIPDDIYPNYPIEDGPIMGSCKEYFTRFNLGSFPRKISIEEAEKRWGRRLVIVANQKIRTKVLIPEDKQCTLNISVRYYLMLERIGRSRYLGEGSFGTHSLRSIFSDSKVLSYMRNRLTDYGLIKNQVHAYSGKITQIANPNRIVISSLVRFFIKRQSMIDIMVSRIVDFLKSQPNYVASYEQVKSECNVSVAKTFKQPQLKKFCDTNLKLKYREVYPNATEEEYLYKKVPNERIIRCIKLKYIEEQENSEKKMAIEGREFKQDCTYERQVLRWIEKHGDLGVALSEISRAFRFTTDGSLERVLKELTSLNYLSKRYCDRGRTKVFCYIANNYNLIYKNDDIEIENLPAIKSPVTQSSENNSSVIETESMVKTDIDNIENLPEIKSPVTQSSENNSNIIVIEPLTKTVVDNIKHESVEEINELPQFEDEDNNECDIEKAITRVMEHEYCKSVFEKSKQTVSLTDRFIFRQNIIFNMLYKENITTLINIKKHIIETEKKNPLFIGTLDIKTLIKIIGYFEQMGKLKTVQYRVTYETKTVNQLFVGISSVNFSSPEVISYMNSFLNRFNNSMKTTKAHKKWNLKVTNSPNPKINIAELKLPRFMKMRSLHEYLYYIVYDHPRESLLNVCNQTEENVASYRNDISKGDEAEAELPKVYYPHIGWKMFVQPLPKYPKYPNGWFFVSDIIHHMPLDLMLKIVNFNQSKINLEKLNNYATHPVFKYLPLMALSSEVRSMLSQGIKKHVQNTLNVLRLLCMIGLLQFGPKTYKDTELIFVYLNRNASLLNTVKSNPSYYRVSDINYEKRTYKFYSNDELETFWLDTWYFCTNTPLGYRIMKSVNIPKRREIIEKSKSAIEESCVPRSAFEAVTKDVGIIPGDNKGAAGFDSHLFAHLARNWSTKKKCSTVSNKKISKLNILLMQRQKKHFNNRKINEKKRSEITSNHLYKIRFKWTSDEDQILLLWKLGTMIIKQVKSHAFLSYGIKDVVKSIFGKFYRVKSIDNYLRRIRYLMRYSSIENSIAVLYNEIKADEEIQNIFKKDIEKQHELYDTKKYKAMRDLIVTNIKKLIMLLRARNTTIDTQCVSSRIKKILPDVKQEECLNANNIEMVYKYSDIPCFQEDIVPDHDYRFTTEEISMSVVTSLIHSSLVNQSSDPRVSFSYLQAFKQFPEDILKQSFNIIKDNNIITCSQYHKASLQILLSTSHIIQSKTYDYSSKYSSILIGTTDIGRYVDAFKAYSDIKEYLSEQKLLLLFPTYGLCPALTSLCLTNVVDLSIEFDKKYLEYMLDENLDEGSKCLKNTLKRMRSRHFDLLSSSNDSVDYVKIITSVTKQLKNYQVICKLKQSFQNFEEEIDLVSKHIFSSKPTFKPQVEFIGKLNELSKQILEFCKINAQLGVSQLEIKKHFKDVSPSILTKSLWYLIEKDLILKAGISVPAFVHYQFTDLWLVKIPTLNLPIIKNSDHSTIIEDENNIIMTELALKDSIEPPFKRIRLDLKENVNTENLNYLKVRPWTRLDLSINKENLKTFLNSVLSKIIIKPGIYLKTLKKEYELIIPPIYIRELVEMLESLKCIKMIHFKNACKPSFFSNPSPLNHNLIFSDVKGLEEESLIMLEPTLDCEIRFGYFSCKFDSYTTE